MCQRCSARQWKNAGILSWNISCVSTVLVETIPRAIVVRRNARSAEGHITLSCTKTASKLLPKHVGVLWWKPTMPLLCKSRRVRRRQSMKSFRALSHQRQLRTRIARFAWWSFLSVYMETTIHHLTIRTVYWIAVKKSHSVPNLSFKSFKYVANQWQRPSQEWTECNLNMVIL